MCCSACLSVTWILVLSVYVLAEPTHAVSSGRYSYQAFPVTIHWGPWSSPSACSRTCGVGVAVRERTCLKVYNSRIHIAIHPSQCSGSPIDYRTCNKQPCPQRSLDIRVAQCAVHNRKIYHGIRYRWRPYTSVNGRYPHNPCALVCHNGERVLQFAEKTIDGTSCKTEQFEGICVDGLCEPTGCDNELHSKAVFDWCGVCQGDNSTCHVISGYITLSIGMESKTVLHLPRRARHIVIREETQTVAVFAIKDSRELYYISGYSVYPMGRQNIGGTVFWYYHPIYDGEHERMAAEGPINRELTVVVLSRNKKTDTVKVYYEYTVPLQIYPDIYKGKDDAKIPNSSSAPLLEHSLSTTHETTVAPTEPPKRNVKHSDGATDYPTRSSHKKNGFVTENEISEKMHRAHSLQREKIYDNDEIGNVPKAPSDIALKLPYKITEDEQENSKNSSPLLPSLPTKIGTTVTAQPKKQILLKSNISYAPVGNLDVAPSVEKATVSGSPKKHVIPSNVRSDAAHAQSISSDAMTSTLSPSTFAVTSPTFLLIKTSSSSSSSLFNLNMPQNAFKTQETSTAITKAPATTPTPLRIMLAPPPPMPLIMKPKPKRLMNVIHETRRPDAAPVFVRESLLDGQGLEATTVAYGKDGDMYINTTKDTAPSKEDLPKGVPAPAVSSDYRNPETNAEKADYRWVVNGKAPCSATCTTGLQSTYAQCQRKNGMVVEDANCDETKRPEPTHAVCFGKPCYARWVEGLWSQCSRSCGDGEQYRNVRCWQMMAPGFDSSVHDFLCDARRKPQYLRRCKERDCGPLWQVSEWTECSTKCGYGIQRREVRCSARQEDECVVGKKPAHEQRCYLGPCVNQWTVSEWSECSGPCGSGLRSRSVTCRDVNGNYLPSTQCDQGNRPIAVQACGDQPTCHPTWVPQEWGQCSADCGEGRANRKILCGAVVNNNFIVQPDAYCASKERPVDEATCQAKPCEAQWFTTQWSKCSKTCGDNGVRVRTAKCYRKHSDSTAACDEKKKPATVEVCNMPPCEPLTPGGGCRDDKTANCALVLRVQLCDHWYYKKACCASCKADKRKNGS